MATKRPVKRLDLEAMSNAEVLAELGRIYGNVLDRLSVHREIGEGDEENDPAPDAIDQGVLLLTRVQTLTGDFSYGRGGRVRGVLLDANGDHWGWGLNHFRDKLEDASADIAIVGEAVAS